MNSTPSPSAAPLPEPLPVPAAPAARIELNFIPQLPSRLKYAMRRRPAYRHYELLRKHCAFLLEQALIREPMWGYEAAKLLRISIQDYRCLKSFVSEYRTACRAALTTQDWTEIEAIIIGPGEREANPSRYAQLQHYLAAHCVVPLAPKKDDEPPATPVNRANPPTASVPSTVPPPPPPAPVPAAEPAVPTPSVTAAPPASGAPTPPRRLTLDEIRRTHQEIEYWVQLGMIAADVFTAEGVRRLLPDSETGSKQTTQEKRIGSP
jgi:hypothetical protein